VSPQPPTVPDFGYASLAELGPSLLAALGVPGFANALALRAVSTACLLVVDGLGANNLAEHPDESPFLTSLLATGRRLSAGFPATTATSLTTLGTGVPPGEHGMLGYQVAIPGEGRLLNLLRWDDGIDPLRWQPQPTVFERATAAGIAVSRVSASAFQYSGLTLAALRGGQHVGSDSGGERVADAVAALHESARTERPALVYAYVPELDATGHRRGWRSAAWREQLALVDRLVQRLAEGLPAGCALLVTADHGMVDVPIDVRFGAELDQAPGRVDIDRTPVLDAGLALLGGEARARHVYSNPGAADDVLMTWRGVLGDRAWVLSRDEAVEAGWFGPRVSEAALPRIGDVVVAARETNAFIASVREPKESALVGMHGSLTAIEQQVPLLCVQT
jgi:predicted AlkP superfamily pyrophosphatase or phosphodiesterase